MKLPLLTFATALHALGGLSLAHGQGAPRPVPVRVVVTEVSDSRSTGELKGTCTVGLKFTGDAAIESLDLIRVNLKTALDDLNRDLIFNDNQRNDYFLDTRHAGLSRISLTLRNPSRNATVIKLLEGEVELFNPTIANGGLVTIKDFFKLPPAPMQHPSLIKNDIAVLYLTQAGFEARRAELMARYKNYLHNEWPERLAGLLLIVDENGTIASFEVQQPDGKSLGRGTTAVDAGAMGGSRRLNFQKVPATGTVLKITLKTPETIRTIPFKLEKIQLP